MRNEHLEYPLPFLPTFSTRAVPILPLPAAALALSGPAAAGIPSASGNYYADAATLDRLETNGQVLFRYCEPSGAVTGAANPNGSARNIAGIINETGNVLGMMPHPERSCEALLGSEDGNLIFESVIDAVGSAD